MAETCFHFVATADMSHGTESPRLYLERQINEVLQKGFTINHIQYSTSEFNSRLVFSVLIIVE